MARIDDYAKALEIAKEELSSRNPLHFCRLSGALFIEKKDEPTIIRLTFLNRIITISWPDLLFYQDSNQKIPIKEKILILHYLNGSNKENPTGELIAYQDIPSGRFYLDAFNRRVKYPLINTFGDQPDKLSLLAKELFGATTSSIGDISVLIQALPKIPVTFVIWKGDEEFSSDGTILFDSSIKNILSAEDVSELTSMIVYPLIAKAG
ncbi:MAG: hypothetical protein DRG66_04960 [Deltaproteobacteria bacterium]|nr:MAG: hypothetical protein DRG66_04960 [Deltaproteobacteria bacterium]